MIEEAEYVVTFELHNVIIFSPIERDTPLTEADAIANAYGTVNNEVWEDLRGEGWDITPTVKKLPPEEPLGTSTPVDRIIVALKQLYLDIESDGEDAYALGQENGLLQALAICVGSREAIRLLAREEVHRARRG